jgi:type I restriction enzyme S subunit
MAKIGERCGASAILPDTHETGILSGNALKITVDEARHSTFYVWQILWNLHVSGKMELLRTVGAQPAISMANLKKHKIPLPPTKAEQEAIAEALSDADALIESLSLLLAKKRHLKQGAMQQLLTGKKRLPGFSGAWEVKTLGDLFNFSGGFTASRDQLSTDGYCYLHYGDIHTSNKTFVDVRSEHQDIPKLNVPLKKVSPVSLLDDGDVVFVDASEDDEGTSKHVVISNPDKTPFISGLHTIVAKSRTNELDHLYRRYCFQTRAIKTQFRFFAVGTKVSGISKSNIAKITLSAPSVPEQTAIATILSDMDGEIAALDEKLAKARNLKQGMMQELLTGRIRLV